MPKIHFHGHAAFSIAEGDSHVLIDPFLKPNNPVADLTAEEVEATDILLTHGHPDHVSDALAVARRTNARLTAVHEVAVWMQKQGVKEINDPNLGGTVKLPWGWVKLVPAWHTNTLPDGTSIGVPAGLVINIGGKTIYHLGDTALFSDLKLVGERTPVDVALIPIGGHYTMDIHDGAFAAKLVGAKTVIPCHYNTFPKISADDSAFQKTVEAETDTRVVILKPGQDYEL